MKKRYTMNNLKNESTKAEELMHDTSKKMDSTRNQIEC